MTTHSLDIDCRGMRSPAPILEVARAARQLVHRPTMLHIYADDDNFPSNLAAWCQTIDAQLRWLTPPPEGGFHGLVALHGATLPGPQRPATPSMIPGPQLRQLPDGTTTPPLHGHEDAPTTLSTLPRASYRDAPTTLATTPPPPLRQPDLLDLRGVASHVGLLQLSSLLLANRTGVKVVSDDPSFRQALYTWASTTCAEITDVCRERAFSATVRLPAGATGTLVPTGADADADLAEQPTLLDLPTNPRLPATGDLLPIRDQVPRQDLATILLMHDSSESLISSLLTANAAADQGMEVVVFFSFWGLHALAPPQEQRIVPRSLLERIARWLLPQRGRRPLLSQLDPGGTGARLAQRVLWRQHGPETRELMRRASEQGVRFQACTLSMNVMGLARSDLIELPNLELQSINAFAESARRSAMSLTF